MQFPTVQGANLLRQSITLPDDFAGELNIVLIPFQQWQQTVVDGWIPTAQQLETDFPGVIYYELPTIQKMNFLSRTFINEGMRAGIPNNKTRQRTITLYLDKQKFRQALDLPDEGTIYLLLLNRQGQVLWRAEGGYEPHKAASLREVITAHFSA